MIIRDNVVCHTGVYSKYSVGDVVIILDYGYHCLKPMEVFHKSTFKFNSIDNFCNGVPLIGYRFLNDDPKYHFMRWKILDVGTYRDGYVVLLRNRERGCILLYLPSYAIHGGILEMPLHIVRKAKKHISVCHINN